MYALVRFRDEKELHVVNVEDIEDFNPEDEKDFESKALYQVFWQDQRGEDSGFYPAQILMLAECEEELKDREKRVPKPRIIDDDDTDELPTASQRTKVKQVQKRKKQNESAARKLNYQTILKNNIGAAHYSMKMAAKHNKGPKRPQDFSSDDSDQEYLISSEEFRIMKRENKSVKEECRRLREENLFLREQVQSLQKCLQAKIFSLDQARSPALDAGADSAEASRDGSGALHTAAVQAAHGPLPPSDAVLTQNVGGPPVGAQVHGDPSMSTIASNTPTDISTTGVLSPSTYENFTFLADGSFHLQEGIVVPGSTAAKLLGCKRATIVAKDTAHAIWTREGLMARSVSGLLPPKERAPGRAGKPPLTPEKVDVVAATVRYWGARKGVAVEDTVRNLSRVLSEKIQDLLRKEKKKQQILQQ